MAFSPLIEKASLLKALTNIFSGRVVMGPLNFDRLGGVGSVDFRQSWTEASLRLEVSTSLSSSFVKP